MATFVKTTLSILFTFLLLHPLWAQSGKVYDNLTFESKILNMERKYAIYLPPDYETSERSYPILYLLHGAGDDQTGWVQFGEVQCIADKAIFEGSATPMIIVMPDAEAGRRGYYNHLDGSWNYEDFFFEEFIPHIESSYRIRSEKQYRAIAGLSMGGGGTFIYALHHPEMFSSACPLSGVTEPLNLEHAKFRLDRRNMAWETEEDLERYYKTHGVVYLMENMDIEQLKSIKWYIDCGDDDFLYEGNALVHIAMKKREIPHEYRVRDGGHNWAYWRSALPEVLQFITKTFHR